MGRNELKKDILKRKGLIFSEATLRAEDLLASAYELFEEYDIRTPLRKEIKELLATIDDFGWFPPEKREEAEELLNEDVFYFLQELSPAGYVFSSLPGDGACFGWWSIDVFGVDG